MIRCLFDLSDKVLNTRESRRVCGNGYGTGIGMFVGKGIQGFASRFAGRGLAGSDVDFGTARLEKTELENQ